MKYILALSLVALPFVSERGSRASLFGWVAFAFVLSVAKYLSERSLGVDARQGHLDGDPASGLYSAQQ